MRKMSLRRVIALSLGCLVPFLVVLTGCSEPKPDGMPKLYPVSLTFLLDGAPCEGVAVFLSSQDGNPWPVGGATNKDGVVSLSTQGQYPGVAPGKYKIAVSKSESEGNKLFDVINPDYGSSNKTPFVIEVVAGKNSFDPFDLGKKVRVPQPVDTVP